MAAGPKTRPKRFQGLMRISEAAELLGVTSETLRNWDKWGWLKPIRNPKSRYRYYKREALEKYLEEQTTQHDAGT